MIAVRMHNGAFAKIGDDLEVFSDNELFARWLVVDIDAEKKEITVDQTDAEGYTAQGIKIPLNLWDGAEVVELTSDDINKDPNLAFRFRKVGE